MKNIAFLIVLLFLFSCKKEKQNSLNGEWKLVSAENYVSIRDIDSTYSIQYPNNQNEGIYENSGLYIDTINVNNTEWNISEASILVNSKNSYNYNLITYDRYIDVSIPPLKRVYEILTINKKNLIIKTPEQYSGELGEKNVYSILTFIRE